MLKLWFVSLKSRRDIIEKYMYKHTHTNAYEIFSNKQHPTGEKNQCFQHAVAEHGVK